MSNGKLARRLREIASVALLGAVLAGIGTAWIDRPPVDFHAVGAIVGCMIAVAIGPSQRGRGREH